MKIKDSNIKSSDDSKFSFINMLAEFAARLVFHRVVIRNELKGIKEPYILICNHECALDPVLLLGLLPQTTTYVMSDQFYFTVPFKRLMKKRNIIHKLQFATTLSDVKKMMGAVRKGSGGLVLFPAGLMCADGKSTPLPKATGQFIQFLNVPVYIARIYGSYFVQPKWSKRLHPGKTEVDIYRLFGAEELKQSSTEAVEQKIHNAIDFDAYREQERLRARCKNARNIEGLENVLYRCPDCGEAYTVKVINRHTISCTSCGYTERADEYGFLHLVGDVGKEIRYASDWSRQIYLDLKAEIEKEPAFALSTPADIRILNREAGRFESIGRGNVTLSREGFTVESVAEGGFLIKASTAGMPSLPVKPGKCFDIQAGNEIYRCFPDDGRRAIQFVHITEIMYEL